VLKYIVNRCRDPGYQVTWVNNKSVPTMLWWLLWFWKICSPWYNV